MSANIAKLLHFLTLYYNFYHAPTDYPEIIQKNVVLVPWNLVLATVSPMESCLGNSESRDIHLAGVPPATSIPEAYF